MDQPGIAFITLGGLLLLGLATDFLGRRTALPRVTLLLAFGFLLGPMALDLVSEFSEQWFPLVTDIALLMVGFLLGGKLAFAWDGHTARQIFWISLSEVLITAGAITLGLLVLGFPLEIALLLGGIGTATDPAATTDVLEETGASGPFSHLLVGIVAIDDAWGLIAFSIMLALAQSLTGNGIADGVLLHAAWELGGAVMLGVMLGLPMAYLTGRIRPGEPTLVEALGLIFLVGGLALWLEVSHLLSAMVLGLVVALRAAHHERPFHAIENIEWPFMILFFVLAGTALDVHGLLGAGLAGVAYIGLRVLGRVLGGWPGGWLAGAEPLTRRWVGMALLPQAGVAMGMALIATQRFPEHRELILPVVIGATVLFELVGPILTRYSLIRTRSVGEPS